MGQPAWALVIQCVTGNAVYTITPDGTSTLIREKAGFPNGHAFGDDGKVAVAQNDHALKSCHGGGTDFNLLINSYGGKKISIPNDVNIGKEDVSTSQTQCSVCGGMVLKKLILSLPTRASTSLPMGH